jgi:hypothetical protein
MLIKIGLVGLLLTLWMILSPVDSAHADEATIQVSPTPNPTSDTATVTAEPDTFLKYPFFLLLYSFFLDKFSFIRFFEVKINFFRKKKLISGNFTPGKFLKINFSENFTPGKF